MLPNHLTSDIALNGTISVTRTSCKFRMLLKPSIKEGNGEKDSTLYCIAYTGAICSALAKFVAPSTIFKKNPIR